MPKQKPPSAAPGKQAASQASVVFTFADGAKHRLSVYDYDLQMQRQWLAMAESDDPELREAGRARLRERTDLLFATHLEREARAAQRARGGASSGEVRKQRAQSDWQIECVKAARELLAGGDEPRSISGKLARRFGKDAGTVRDVLKKAGVK